MKRVLPFIISLLLCFSFNVYAKALPELLIGGSYYQRIIEVKDVIADVLPPPVYIVESYLMSFLMINEAEKAMKDKKIDAKEFKAINDQVEYLRQLKEGISENAEEEGYFSRVEMWNSDLKDSNENLKKIKELMTKTGVEPVREFYLIFETKFIPAIKAGDVRQAKVIQNQLGDIFLRHKIIVNEIVTLAQKNIHNLEAQASKNEMDALIKGPIYNKIILMKDLIADILPPPSFIIESYLLCWEMLNEVEQNGSKSEKFKTMKADGEKLKLSYQARHDYWTKELKVKSLRPVMLEDAYFPAKKFYTIYEKNYLPMLDKNKISLAKKIINNKLTSFFQKHRQVIDKLVLKADNKAIEIESEMALHLSGQKKNL